MILELLGKIKDAEEEAADIIHTAQKKAKEIEDETTDEIGKLDFDTQNKAAKLNLHEETLPETTPKTIEIKVDKKHREEAKKLILAEFHKRWAK